MTVQHFYTKLGTAVKDDTDLVRFFGVVYSVVGQTPNPSIVELLFICWDLLSMTIGDRGLHERGVVTSECAVPYQL